MKLTKSIITILLLLFVAATVGTLIAQEVARPKVQVAEANESTLPVEPSVPVSSEPATSEQEPVLNESAVVDETQLAEADVLDEVSVAEEMGESLAVAPSLTEAPSVIEAIYFHNTYRCVTCTKIESEAKAIVEAEFDDQYGRGAYLHQPLRPSHAIACTDPKGRKRGCGLDYATRDVESDSIVNEVLRIHYR